MSKEHGIGNWSLDDFSNAVRQGINPQGQHYFPAFPYVAYSKMTDQDLIDLWAFWQTLPINELPSQAHEIPWPFSMRQTLGLWKRLFSERDYRFAENTRGAYLVEALGHCGEVKSPPLPPLILGGPKMISSIIWKQALHQNTMWSEGIWRR